MVKQDDTTHAPRTALSDLVRDRRTELRLSLKAVEERSIPEGGGEPVVKTGWLHRLERRDSVIPPQVPELTALARALELPLGRLQDAAGSQFLGIDTVWSASGEARAFVEQLERFTPEQREQLARLLAAFENPGRGQ